jgi:replicative superfamily II helicase
MAPKENLMTKYRNPRHEQENLELEEAEQEMAFMAEPAASADDEVWKKRYGDLRRHSDGEIKKAKDRMTELENKLNQALRGQLKAPKSDEDIESWMKEYPEFSGILEAIVQKRIREATSQTEEKISKFEFKQKELDAKEAFMELRTLHPDLNELLGKDSEFRKWLEKQPQKIRDKMNGLDVDEADLVIRAYKSEKNPKKSKVDDEGFDVRGAAKAVRTPATGNELVDDFGDYEFTESQIEKESSRNRRWFEQNEAKIAEAARKGKILYDISGGAR